MTLTEAQKTALEKLIDHARLSDVLEAITEICFDKAEHLESNWQDAHSAKVWNSLGQAIDKVACKAVAENL